MSKKQLRYGSGFKGLLDPDSLKMDPKPCPGPMPLLADVHTAHPIAYISLFTSTSGHLGHHRCSPGTPVGASQKWLSKVTTLPFRLVDRYLRKLDQELHKFQLELEADNRYGNPADFGPCNQCPGAGLFFYWKRNQNLRWLRLHPEK